MQDIVHRRASSERLVIAFGVEGEGADELTILGDDPDVWSGDEESHLAVFVGHADGDVTELAEVAQGDRAEGVDLVSADAVVDCWRRSSGLGLDEGPEDSHRCLAAEGAMGPDVVVVVTESIELELQLRE